MFLVETLFLDGLGCRLPVFLRKGGTGQNKDQEARLHGGKSY
jgi:hypothetical protein